MELTWLVGILILLGTIVGVIIGITFLIFKKEKKTALKASMEGNKIDA